MFIYCLLMFSVLSSYSCFYWYPQPWRKCIMFGQYHYMSCFVLSHISFLISNKQRNWKIFSRTNSYYHKNICLFARSWWATTIASSSTLSSIMQRSFISKFSSDVRADAHSVWLKLGIVWQVPWFHVDGGWSNVTVLRLYADFYCIKCSDLC